MTDISKIDQRYAEAQGALDQLVEGIGKSLDRKRERHGEKFDNARALTDFIRAVGSMHSKQRTIMLAAALQRLAQGDSFTEIADLDFEINVKNINFTDEEES